MYQLEQTKVGQKKKRVPTWVKCKPKDLINHKFESAHCDSAVLTMVIIGPPRAGSPLFQMDNFTTMSKMQGENLRLPHK